MIKYIVLILSIINIPMAAHAVFEFRGHYNFLNYSPDLLNKNLTTGKLDQAKGFGGDAIYSIEAGRIPLGVRYEKLSEKKNSSVINRDIDLTLTQALVGFRFLLTGDGYLGVIGAYPITGKVDYSDNVPLSAKSETISGGTIGLEGALRLKDNYTVGIETGISKWKAKSFNSNGASVNYNSEPMAIDYSGTYYRLVLGLIF